MGQIEAVAANAPQQILVQQAPGGGPVSNLQGILQLPAYPASDTAGSPLHGFLPVSLQLRT